MPIYTGIHDIPPHDTGTGPGEAIQQSSVQAYKHYQPGTGSAMSDDSEERATIWMSSDLRERVDDSVDWKDSSLSAWMRRAAEDRLLIEKLLEEGEIELPGDDRDREREAVLRDVLISGLDEHDG